MRTRNLLAITLAVVLASSWLSIVLYPSVMDFMEANPFWNGVRDFSRRLDAENLVSLDQMAPETNVLVVIPYLPYAEAELRRLAEFVDNGGTLLVLDDYGYGNQVLEALGLDMRFAAAPLLDPYLNFRNQRLPLITDLAPGMKDAGIKELVLNHATALSFSPQSANGSGYEILARSSDMSFLDANGNAARDRDETRGPLAVAARTKLGGGTVIAVSDLSILINSMMGRGDNAEFVAKLVSAAGETPRVAVDGAHLRKAPLDTAKDTWAAVRDRLSLPYAQALLAGAVLMLSFIPVWRKGVEIER